MAGPEDLQGGTLVGTPIVIDDEPMIFWHKDDAQTQVEFLESIDPSYFRYLAAIHHAQLEGKDSLRAAVSLRVTYSHALESLFAFVGAALQAPQSPAYWLLKYKNSNLKNLVTTISKRGAFHNDWNLGPAGWQEVAEVLVPWSFESEDGKELRDASARLWRALANDLLDDKFDDEYNSLKHGFRVRSGEWFLNIGAEEVPGTPPPPEQMRRMASSQFGSTFLRPLYLKKHQWGTAEQRVNWDPAVFARRIPLISNSMDNIISFLRCVNGASAERIEVAFFGRDMVSQALHTPNYAGANRFAVWHRINPEELPALSREDIMRDYAQPLQPPEDEP